MTKERVRLVGRRGRGRGLSRDFRPQENLKDAGPLKVTVVVGLNLLADTDERPLERVLTRRVHHLLLRRSVLRAPEKEDELGPVLSVLQLVNSVEDAVTTLSLVLGLLHVLNKLVVGRSRWRRLENPDLLEVISERVDDVPKLVSELDVVEGSDAVLLYGHPGGHC